MLFLFIELPVLGLVFRDIVTTLTASKIRLVAEAKNRLNILRNSYAVSDYARWAQSWTDVENRVIGSGPLRLHERQLVVPLNEAIQSFAFDFPACRHYTEAAAPIVACTIYNPSARTLQFVGAWPEPDWVVAQEGDTRLDTDDRLVITIAEPKTLTMVLSPQVSYRNRARLARCAPEWALGVMTSRPCSSTAVAVHHVKADGRLGEAWPASGIALRSSECPRGIAPPCTLIAVSVRLEPPSPNQVVCIDRREATQLTDRSTVVASTCRPGSVDPLPGQFTDPGFRVRQQNEARCSDGVPCLCPKADAPETECLAVTSGRRSQNIPESAMAPSVWSTLAEQVIQAVLTVTSISRLDAKLPLYGPAAQQGVLAYLVERTKPGAVVENSVSEISSRIALYTWALLSPLFLTWIMGWALLRARERQRQTERERIDDQERAEQGRLERSALVERDAAIAARALADSALKGATAGMQDLGHEIASPAQSLRSALEQFKEIAGSNPVGKSLLEKSHLDLMDGYISRISHAAERVRHGLQLQLRHAASIKTHEVIDLAVYMRKRLEAEQVDAGLKYELCAPELGAWVLAEPGTLEEVIGNVLANTARFRNERPVSVALKIDRPLVTLAIRNEGPIIPRGFEERIFESRVSLVPASDATSHGHGLFIARMAMSALGGTIVARNDEEPACTGVTFVITLPMASALSSG